MSHVITDYAGETEESKVFNSLPLVTEEFLNNYLAGKCEETVTSLSQFPDPYLFKGMKEAVDIYLWAVKNDKRILHVCDSDCDGVGTFIVNTDWYKYFGYKNVEFIIVKRHEGYGFIPKHITERTIKPDLIITSDNGITAHAAVDLATELGIYTIITDHHQLNHLGLPKATAVVDPHQPGCTFPYKDINGTFVLWYFFKAVADKLCLNFKDYWYDMLSAELCLTTIADVMPLKHINRFIVKDALPKFFTSPKPWVKAFMDDKKELSSEDLSFGLIPSINAAARLADAVDAANFLYSPDFRTANNWLIYLRRLNDNRKERQELLDKEIVTNYESFVTQPFILIPGMGEKFHKGILGPCSGRVAEKFNKPTIVMTLSHDGKHYSGSGRSVGSIDLLGIVKNSKYVDLNKSGGHKAACGVTVPTENLSYFWKDLQEVTQDLPIEAFRPKIEAMGRLPINKIDTDIYELIKSYEPFGEAFQKPAFVDEGLFKEVKFIGKLQNHMKGRIEDATGASIPFLWFFFNTPIKKGEKRRFLYVIAKDDFASEKSGELELCIHIKSIISNI